MIVLVSLRSRDILVLDVSAPGTPTLLGRVDGLPSGTGAFDFAASRDTLYVALAGIRQIEGGPFQVLAVDVSDPSEPQITGRYDGVTLQWTRMGQGVGLLPGSHVVIGAGDGLFVFHISDDTRAFTEPVARRWPRAHAEGAPVRAGFLTRRTMALQFRSSIGSSVTGRTRMGR